MKLSMLVFILLGGMAMISACSQKVTVVKSTPSGKVPPGQAKKMMGSQSAKSFAPGQQKKKGH